MTPRGQQGGRRAPHYLRGLPFQLGADGGRPMHGKGEPRTGIDPAAERVARLCESALLASEDEVVAKEALEQTARLGSVDAAYAAAVLLIARGEGAADAAPALELLRFAAGNGLKEAALVLGKILCSTPGSDVDGVSWLRAAAEAGEPEALHLLGLACFRGQGVDKDLVRARQLQEDAAEQGVVDAQFELSLMLAQGLGGKRDARGAHRWEDKAAEAGHARACLNRAVRLARKKKPDFAMAMCWYERAVEGGSAEAAARLCRMYLAGQGVTRNEGTAEHWYKRAAELGYAWSTEKRR